MIKSTDFSDFYKTLNNIRAKFGLGGIAGHIPKPEEIAHWSTPTAFKMAMTDTYTAVRKKGYKTLTAVSITDAMTGKLIMQKSQIESNLASWSKACANFANFSSNYSKYSNYSSDDSHNGNYGNYNSDNGHNTAVNGDDTFLANKAGEGGGSNSSVDSSDKTWHSCTNNFIHSSGY